MTLILRDFSIGDLRGDPRGKTALLINPPVYDTQYWAQWSQPYGLLRIGALLKKHGYRWLALYDFMEPDARRKVPQHRISAGETYEEQDKPTRPLKAFVVAKKGRSLELNKYHFGRTWPEFEAWLDAQGFGSATPPDEVWISATMTYWWESVRDLTARLRRRFGSRTTILLGGIYPTLVPEHAARHTQADIVAVGEVEEASDLWPDLSLYETAPAYAIVTPSRGCPYHCAYCAQRTINHGRRAVDYRPSEDIVAEMRHRYETYGIREFAFYADFLLGDAERNFQQVLERIVAERLPFRLHAPEGLDTRHLSQSQRLVDLLKEARFEKLYLPCESVDDGYLRTLNRRHVRLDHFVRAAQMAEKAGFRMRNLEVNAFVLYGLPGETIDQVVKTSLLVSDVVGSIIPMLFTPVPTTQLYGAHVGYFHERGWDRDLHMLNGKLFPFLAMNEGSLDDYVDLQRLMFMLNTHYRSQSFRVFGESRVSAAFRENVRNQFGERLRQHRNVEPIEGSPDVGQEEACAG